MSTPRTFITRVVPQEAIQMVRDHTDAELWEEDRPIPRDLLLSKLHDVEGLYSLLTERIDAELLDAAPKLRVVSNMAVGFDNVDVAECTRRGIPVGNTPGVLTETTADLAFALLLSAARRLSENERFVHAGKWKTWSPMLMLGVDLYGATLGIVGMGRIGAAVARRAFGFGMQVIYNNNTPNPEIEILTGARPVSFDELLAQSDFISIHGPLTPQTRYMFSTEQFKKMKNSAILVNTGRGPMVDHRALYIALRDGEIASAALDVTDPEPIPMTDPLLTLDNCLIVPHIGSASIATRTRMAVMAAENLLAGLRGERLPNVVNPQVYEAK
jgi:lactate dehydrogenase-like 2-hydroxyacid dehydrogenase